MPAAGDEVMDTICKSFEDPDVKGNAESFQSEFDMFNCGDLKKNQSSTDDHLKLQGQNATEHLLTTKSFTKTPDNFESSTVKLLRKTVTASNFSKLESTKKPTEVSKETKKESATDYQTLIKEIAVLQASLQKVKSEIAAVKTRKSSSDENTLENLSKTRNKLQDSLEKKLQVDKNLSKIFQSFEKDSQENREKSLTKDIEDIESDKKALEKKLQGVFQVVNELEDSLNVNGLNKKQQKLLQKEIHDLQRETNKQIMNIEFFSKLSMNYLNANKVDESKVQLVKEKLKKMTNDLENHSDRVESFNKKNIKLQTFTSADEENEALKKELLEKQLKIDQLEKSLKSRSKRDVNNHAKGKVIISNQDLKEENVKVIRKNDRPIKTKDQVVKYLKDTVLMKRKSGDIADIKESMSDEEVRDVDTMIYMMEKYPNLKPSLTTTILGIVDIPEQKAFAEGSQVMSHDDFNNMSNIGRFKRSLNFTDEEKVKNQIQRIMDTYQKSKLFQTLNKKYINFLSKPKLLDEVFPTLDKQIIQDLKTLMELQERHVYLKPFVAVSVLNVMYNSSNSKNSKNSNKSNNAVDAIQRN